VVAPKKTSHEYFDKKVFLMESIPLGFGYFLITTICYQQSYHEILDQSSSFLVAILDHFDFSHLYLIHQTDLPFPKKIDFLVIFKYLPMFCIIWNGSSMSHFNFNFRWRVLVCLKILAEITRELAGILHNLGIVMILKVGNKFSKRFHTRFL